MSSPAERRLLADFLRAHRERMAPHAAGLPAGPAGGSARRRTPGLRREEVAQLCGISATWYTWLEQGRDVSASPQAIARLAAGMAMSPAERAYLFELAGRRDPASPPSAAGGDVPADLAATVAAVTAPAYLLDRAWTAIAWNPPAARLFAAWLGGAEANLVAYVFLDPGARDFIVDWEERARRLVAEFRADFGRGVADPRIQALVDRLRAGSAAFAAFWDEQAVMGRDGGRRRFQHPEDGPLAFEQVTLVPAARPDHKLVVLLGPAVLSGGG